MPLTEDIERLTSVADSCGFDPESRLVQWMVIDQDIDEVLYVGPWEGAMKACFRHEGNTTVKQTISFDAKDVE